jgi:hypothetical protein
MVADDKTGVQFLNGPRRREAARHHCPSFVRPRHPAAPLAPNIGLIVGSHIEKKNLGEQKMLRIFVTAVTLTALVTPALADYWVVQESDYS